MTTQQQPPIDTPALVQATGAQATKTTDSGVVTAAQLSAGATGKDTDVIGVAAEAFDNVGGGADTLVGVEGAVIDLDDDNDTKPHFGFDAVAKVRMDNAAPERHRVLNDSAAFRASAQPETGFQDLLRAEPGTIDRTLINAPGNPGATFARLSGDMVIWRDKVIREDATGTTVMRTLYAPVVIDGELWGIPLTYLGK